MSAELNNAVESLRKATKGLGTDEKALIETLVRLPVHVLPQLNAYYKANYGKALEDVLKSETSGDFGKLLRMVVQDEALVTARSIRQAVSGLGSDKEYLGETLIGRSNAEMKAIKEAYKAEFNEDLEKRLVSELKGDIEKLFVVLLQAMRDEAGEFTNVDADVETLYKAGQGTMGTDEAEFIRILANRNTRHLNNVFVAYGKKHERTIANVIKKEFTGKLETLLLNQVRYIEDRGLYFAELLESSMAGMGTNEDKLSRLVIRIRRAGLIAPVKEAFLKKYGKSLDKRIKGEVKGDYEKLLIALIELP